ncbi:DUF3152 domain-containing protein [bacterium]|nr:MAG: DUF3152 domain-containing protein [bacterium]
MCRLCSVAYATAGIGLAVTGSMSPLGMTTTAAPVDTQMVASRVMRSNSLQEAVVAIKAPTIKQPQWLTDQKNAESAAKAAAVATKPVVAGGRVVTYSVITRGVITADVGQFKQQVNATLNDARGWTNLGVTFQEVATGGQFTLALSEASQMTTFSANGCDTQYSCRVGRYVIINQDRWLGATPSWNTAGGSLRDYRHMVVNHETGHWLGHGHVSCSGAGKAAPVMQQQSISLQGCSFNAWPTSGEMSSTQLGINI